MKKLQITKKKKEERDKKKQMKNQQFVWLEQIYKRLLQLIKTICLQNKEIYKQRKYKMRGKSYEKFYW